MMNADRASAVALSSCIASLLLVCDDPDARRGTCEHMSACDYSVDIAGIAETLWCWPLDGYDLVLIDATDQAADGIILCDHVKKLRPEQRVLILVGQRPGLFPFRVDADAVFSGPPDGPELAGAVSFLLAEPGAGSQPSAEKKAAASATSWRRANC